MTYQAFETSIDQGEPVELYEFIYQATFQRYTSSSKSQTMGAITFAPFALMRSNFKSLASAFENPLEITAFQSFPPAEFFRLQAPSVSMAIRVYRKHELDPDFKIAYVGRVIGANWNNDGNEVILSCESDLVAFERNFMRRQYQRGCPWVLYGPGCNLNAPDWRQTAPTFAVSGKTLTAAAFAPFEDNYFAGGYIEYINSVTGIQEYNAVRSSASGVLQLALVPYGLPAAAEVRAYPGCDHTIVTCDTKFNNRPNYGGQPSIPDVNPLGGATLY